MKIEKGMMFLLNQEEYIVGTVKSIKCSKAERYVLTDGLREYIWNNKTKTFSDAIRSDKFTHPSEATLLVLNTPKVETPTGENPNFELIDGDVYTTNDDREFNLFELDEPVKIFNIYYHFIGVTRNKSDNQTAYFTRNGKSSIPSVILNEYKSWNIL